MNKSGKIIRSTIFAIISAIILLSLTVVSSMAESATDAVSVRQLINCTRDDSWYNFTPTSLLGKQLPSYDSPEGLAGGKCIDPHDYASFSGIIYKVVNIIDVNNTTDSNKVRIYGVNSNGTKVDNTYSFTDENVKPIIELAYLSAKGNNDTYAYTGNKMAMAGVINRESNLSQMQKLGISDYVRPIKGYFYPYQEELDAIDAADILAKQPRIEKVDGEATATVGEDGKYYIGPFKLNLIGGVRIGDITVNGNIKPLGITTDKKKLKSVDKLPSNKEFYIVLDKELETITSIKVTAKEEIESLKARLVIVSGGRSQNFLIYRGEMTPTKPEVDLMAKTDGGPEDGTLQIVKKDQFDSSDLNLKDIGFVVWSESKKAYVNVSNGKIKYVDFATAKKNEFKTDKDGKTEEISNLPLGNYKVYETSIPDTLKKYYRLPETKLQDKDGSKVTTNAKVVKVNGKSSIAITSSGQTAIVGATNGRDFSDLYIEKKDKTTGKKLNGIEFKLYKLDTDTEIGGWVVFNNKNEVTSTTATIEKATPIVTVNGRTPTITGLPLGKYQVFESGLGEYSDVYELGATRLNGALVPGHFLKDTETGEIKVEEVVASKTGLVHFEEENKQDYINISGCVWEDVLTGKDEMTRNSLQGNEDYKINGIEVKLVDKTTGETVQTTKTAYSADKKQNGVYKFEKVKVANLNNYYIEFVYDGITYQSVVTPTNSSVKTTDENTSKATETSNSRNTLNSTFKVLTGEGQKVNYNNKEITLSYNKEKQDKNTIVTSKNISDRNKGVDANKKLVTLSKAGDFTINSNTAEGYLSNKYNELVKNSKNNIVKEIENINLGLYVREQPDIALVKDVDKAKVSVNGKTYEYKYGEVIKEEGVETTTGVMFERKNPANENRKYYTPVYKADAAYENEDKSKELQVTITYAIALSNNSEKLYTTINTLSEKYSKELEFIKMYTLSDDKKQEKLISREITENVSGNYKTYKFENMNIKLAPRTSKFVYVEFKLPKEQFYNIAGKELYKNKDFRNYVEISSYSVYADKDFKKLYAGFDIDSIPNNFNPDKYEETIEDDSSRAPGLNIVDAGQRTVNGIVFEDNDKDSKDNERIGDGKYTDGENKISNVKVRLIDSTGKEVKVFDETSKTWVDQKALSNDNGEFTITGFIPGDYTIQYTWGEGQGTTIKNAKNTAVTVDSYKSTVWTTENRKEKESKQWFLQTSPRYSDAQDDYNKRIEFDANNASLLQIVSKQVADTNTVANKAQMTSNTNAIEVGIEAKDYEEVLTGDRKVYKFDIKNIDLGLIERPRQSMDIEKTVETFKLVTDANETILDAKVGKDGKLEITSGKVTGGPTYGYVRGEVDTDIINSGTKALVGYKVKVKNTSEKDYDSKNYYLYGIADSSKEITLKATGIYDYLSGLNPSVNSNTSWEVKQQGTDKTVTQIIAQKIAEGKQSTWYEFDSKANQKQLVEEVAGDKTSKTIEDIIIEMNSTGKTLNEVISKDRVISQFKENGITEIELKAGEEKEIKFSGEQVLSSQNDIIFENGVEISDVVRKTKTGRSVVLEHSNLYDEAELVSVTPPTGEDKNYTPIIIISVAAVAILGAGIILIKKKVLR